EQLETESARLQNQLGDVAARDLESEFDVIGREVSGILQAAREASDAMRERASADAARWRSEAMAEAEQSRSEARADAEAARRDAWTESSELLDQTVKEGTKLREQADRDVLTIMGEAEREAHRLTSGARREAEDVVRSASMDADKITSEAAKRRDDMIDATSRQAAAAQERTRALEQRRDELLDELEKARSTLTRLEGSLEERREGLELASESTSVKVVQPPSSDEEHWELGETVRLIRSEPPAPVPAPAPVVSEPELPAVEVEPPPVEEEPLEPPVTDEPEEPETSETSEEGTDEVGALFASLRSTGDDEAVEDDEPTPEPVAEKPADSRDWIDVRESRLLPITNRALRGTKKAMTELQNIALDSLRTEDDWRPDDAAVAEALQAELIGVWAESFAAGHAVAEEMTGSKLKRPSTPSSKAASDFASALSEDVASALDGAGTGQRERQSAASKVFRVWRTDEAERRIREMAIHSYEKAIESSVAAGDS
ncbi:MAG: hypothetical protein U9N56_09875, partial [Actinomycetota bacterium]|nr:hypothetical protein [Actinomycetota bacterium]